MDFKLKKRYLYLVSSFFFAMSVSGFLVGYIGTSQRLSSGSQAASLTDTNISPFTKALSGGLPSVTPTLPIAASAIGTTPNPTPIVESTPTLLPKAPNFKEYANVGLGLYFQYPDSFKVTEEKKTTGDSTVYRLTIQSSKSDLQMENYIQTSFISQGDIPADAVELKLQENKTVYRIARSDSTNYRYVEKIESADLSGKSTLVKIGSNSYMMSLRSTDVNEVPLFDEIVKSMKRI